MGAKIAALDKDAEGLKALHTELNATGVVCKTYPCDVTKSEECFSAISSVINDLGDIYIMCNNAGMAHRSAFSKTDISVFDRIIAVNLLGAMYCTRAAIDSVTKTGGAVLGIASIAGFAPLCGRTGYAAAKHGLAGFLNTLRTEMEGTGVSVLLVYAQYIQTNIDKNALDAAGNPNKNEKTTTGNVLLPDEAAELIVNALLADERQLLLGEIAKMSWDIYHSDPTTYEKFMMEQNRYVLEQ
jgi:short-subunit dehydrogenase